MSTEPLVFISHKHSDQRIAETIARFLRTRSGGQFRVHLSSSPNFEGPRLGQPLNNELKRALAAAETVILVFTTDTEDWSYCMRECGVATDPRDEHPTSIPPQWSSYSAPRTNLRRMATNFGWTRAASTPCRYS